MVNDGIGLLLNGASSKRITLQPSGSSFNITDEISDLAALLQGSRLGEDRIALSLRFPSRRENVSAGFLRRTRELIGKVQGDDTVVRGTVQAPEGDIRFGRVIIRFRHNIRP